MKGRAHRADPQDDWCEDSWTVDCICGVTFDDGEEMVKCDECGVWVHTRCSRYTKGEELFACDKCKSKSSRNDSEETEVAQLLVELPTKTVRIESSYVGHVPPRRPFRLWTDIPMEERVHVQGVPGGEPGLFEGLSGVFTPELWKCTGYVPKKFNFQYREFPCWDEKKEDKQNGKQNENEIENGNLVDNGAGVLVSLSKERVFGTSIYPMKDTLKDGKKSEDEDMDGRRLQNGARKDRTALHPVVIPSSKRKKDELGASRDRSAKKRSSSAAENEAYEKKRVAQSHKAVFRPGSDAKQLEFYEDRGSKSIKIDIQSVKNKNLKDGVLQEPTLDGNFALNHTVERPKNILVGKGRPSDASTSGMSGDDCSIRFQRKEEKADHQFPASMKSSPKTEDVDALPLVQKDPAITSVKEEGDSMPNDKVDGGLGGSTRSSEEHLVDNLASTALGVQGNQILNESNGTMSHSFGKPDVEVKREMNSDDGSKVVTPQLSPHDDAKDTSTSVHQISETSQMNDVVVGSAQPSHSKTRVIESEAVADCHSDKDKEISGDCSVLKHDLVGLEVPESVLKSSSEPKHVPGSAEEAKPSGIAVTSEEQSIQHKTVACVGKSSSTSPFAVTMSPIPDNSKPTDTLSSNPSTKLRVITENNASIRKEHSVSDIPRDEDRNDLSRKTAKERAKSSSGSTSKIPHQSRISHCSISKRTISESKDCVPSSSSKASSVLNTSVSGESAGSLQSQSASLVQQNKTSASGLPQKGEKFSQSSTHPASKITHASSAHPFAPSNPSTLSDEELALLLHQELNSSPRVPRVPRVRHTGSFPQLASSTATSMLIKRTSSSGGKEHSVVPRRKNKDASKDGSRGSREFDDEAKRSDKGLSSPDQRQDFVSAKRDDKNVPPAPTVTTNSGPSSSTEANDQNLSSMRSSPRNMSDDDTGTARGSVPRTLPGLINEIMSKGRRMTYEELCNAVLPHWPNLRKHNGERYAYSSHSQAVLDCLRNRQKWAQLVDRGPKTNSSRKRRNKADAEESEDNEYSRGRRAKEVQSKSMESQKEEYPKGKRKARKRRRLALQGRGIKDVQRRRKADFSDDDAGPFSNSSEESMFSEDEIQGGGGGGGGCPVGSEASASSDELGTM